MKRGIGPIVTLLLVAVTMSILSTLSAHAANRSSDCSVVVMDVVQTWYYGYYDVCDPATGECNRHHVYLGNDTTVIYGLWCVDAIEVSPDGPPPTYLYRPQVSIVGVDTSNPDAPILTANISEKSWAHPTADVTLYYCGFAAITVNFQGDGEPSLQMPRVIGTPEGNWELRVEAGNNYGTCGDDYAYMFRSEQPAVEKVEEIVAFYPYGDDGWASHLYTHRFAPAYVLSGISMIPHVFLTFAVMGAPVGLSGMC